MEQPKFERMLRLIKLMTGNTNLTVEDLAKRLDTTYRSIYRYIDTFKDAGFVVQKVGAGIYQLVSVNRRVPDLTKIVYFSDEEASVISKLIEGLDNTNTLKQNIARKLANVYASAPVTDFIDRKSNAQNVRDLSDAIKDHKQVILRGYKSSHSNTTADRHIEPFGFTTNHIHVWGYDLRDFKCKMFGISRIGEVDILEQKWEYQKEHKKDAIDIFHMPGDKKIKIVLELGHLAHNLLLEEFPLSEPYITKSGPRKWILSTKVSALQGVGRFVIGLADDIKIIDAPELVEYLKGYSEKHISKLLKGKKKKKELHNA